MRYIADGNGYLLEVSFGAEIVCGGVSCIEYTGDVPAGYDSLMDWLAQEGDKLYRWHIVEGQLTLDSSAAEPAVYVEPEPYSMTLLWENASPSSAFVGQTISLDLSGYDAIQIEFNDTWQTMSPRVNVGKNGGCQQIGDIYTDSPGYMFVAARDISPTTTGVTISSAFHKYVNHNYSEQNNSLLIPYKIYGIKGIKDTTVHRAAICGEFICGEAVCGT